ncbi:MAG: EscU/YscU/HrcU family type III secretion system export apparatus switch protein, partial [Kofleriaceae bacterium]
MADHRPFPPSPRRRALARQAGLHAASPLITGGAAAAAALLAASATAPAAFSRLGTAVVAACGAASAPDPTAALGISAPPDAHDAVLGAATPGAHNPASVLGVATPGAHAPASVLGVAATDGPGAGAAHAGAALPAIVSLALPILGAAALAALVAHLAQTRAPWLPRRRLRGAPVLEAGAIPRARRAGGELAAAGVIAAVAFGWLWWMAPRLAGLAALDPLAAASPHATPPLLAGAAALLISLAVALTIAWLALGAVDAVVRHAALDSALAMTSTEKREDDRLVGADPRWRARRAAIQRGPRLAEAIAGASLLLLGDDAAVAVAWDPLRRPVPVRTASGRGPRARQLLGLARRHRIAVHRDPALTAALVDGDGP